MNALVFGSYTWLIELQTRSTINHPVTKAHTNEAPPLAHVFFAGMGAGVITR